MRVGLVSVVLQDGARAEGQYPTKRDAIAEAFIKLTPPGSGYT